MESRYLGIVHKKSSVANFLSFNMGREAYAGHLIATAVIWLIVMREVTVTLPCSQGVIEELKKANNDHSSIDQKIQDHLAALSNRIANDLTDQKNWWI
ncbi:unnamed protein product [Fusarium graminearum]|nr:unnamed protein product [Fusarium graminearum]CAG2011330.1 unnamed protein product [Fusarium graminearum]CZS75121.1 unnamed protein product [Fusarium graminearum]VTO83930.1 unnamed protein product [Fusarium graminearum]